MAARSISESKRVRYLLGLSSQAEREEIESEYFADEDVFQEMLEVEDNLIDAYARGELKSGERQRFEKIFVSSLRGRNRVRFARAFAGALSTRSAETKLPGTWLDTFKSLRLPGLLRTATIAAMICLVVMVVWLILDRWRMTNEIRELRAEFTELNKRNEALRRTSDVVQTRIPEIAAKPTDPRAQTDKPNHRVRRTTANQQARQLPEVKNDREKPVGIKPEPSEQLPNRDDSTLENTFAKREITELPLEDPNTVNLRSLGPGKTRDGFARVRADESSSDETTIRIPNSHRWIRFQIGLETAATHEDYIVIIKTTTGHSVTSVDWSEPLTPYQTTIDTPVISTSYLPSGHYVLSLRGKEANGLFVKVAEFPFKVIRY